MCYVWNVSKLGVWHQVPKHLSQIGEKLNMTDFGDITEVLLMYFNIMNRKYINDGSSLWL